MLLVDTRGPPETVDTSPANGDDSRLVQDMLDSLPTTEPAADGVDDGFFDSDQLNPEVLKASIALIAPRRSSYIPENRTQDRRQRHRCNRRWAVERTVVCIQHLGQRSIRKERSAVLCHACLHSRMHHPSASTGPRRGLGSIRVHSRMTLEGRALSSSVSARPQRLPRFNQCRTSVTWAQGTAGAISFRQQPGSPSGALPHTTG